MPLEVSIREKSFETTDGGRLTTIRDLAFTVGEGRFACLVGPSGCGKTTTLRLILGLEDEFDGTIVKPEQGRTGVVFQEPRLLPWRTVDRNIRLPLPEDRARADLSALYATLGLTGMENFFPGQLSLGLARRVAIARAFALEPSLLLLDEPFVSLDEPTAERLRRLLMEVWSARPTTALMVTHNLREALELADEIVMLSARPATVRGVYRVDLPRAERTPQAVAAMLAEILALYPPEATDT
ncbi:ABC transporter ATP-binding protein [Zhengella mangrovi]|uniref:ABC transporter ATP-binding protein n=1 Tax=Zhengella mangrovi TaxID=1982044 RepID=UPI001FDF6F55|nr:ABC transporter ATP-binding protein [Zhengella mangrovi]